MNRKRWTMVRARKALGWSQTELATAAEVGLSTITRTETAKCTPRTPEALRMAAKLGISLEELLLVTELVELPTPSPSPGPSGGRGRKASKRAPRAPRPGPVKATTKKRAPKALAAVG